MKKPVEIRKVRGNFEIFFDGIDGRRRKIAVGDDYKRVKQLSIKIDTWLACGLNPEQEIKKLKGDPEAKNDALQKNIGETNRIIDLVDRDLIIRLKLIAAETGKALPMLINESIDRYLTSFENKSGFETAESEQDGIAPGVILTGPEACDYFCKAFVDNLRNGAFITYLGKWVSKRAIDRSKQKSEAEMEALLAALDSTDSDSIRTMLIGSEIESLEFIENNGNGESGFTIQSRHKSNDYNITFDDMILNYRISVVDPATNNAPRTYVYLLGTAFNERVNLLVFNHTD